ncbi:transcription factor bHLH61-like [Triticum dicoccoides]|uniref:transcription factor bHLH61-like n=1 Tax=Triticum dicoccoides TaxID=85692 RepID=UPI00188EF3E4|nr:transcription factor bHLH61-like [Triticum dicoccoides]
MDPLDEESFLEELMPLHREEAPAPPYPGSNSMMTISDLLFYGGGKGCTAEERSGPFQQPMLPSPPAVRPHPHQEFNFNYLSEVCNPWRSCIPDPPAVVQAAAGKAPLTLPLHDAIASSSTFVFGGGAGESSGMRSMPASGTHPESKLNAGSGTPSKNLMAERRRRKRLNDRLSMIRSAVPKISKMDRTATLGDTIDYVKELTERIKTVEEEMGTTPEELNLLKNFSSGGNEETPTRSSTKLCANVENQGGCDTKIKICCSTNPGALIATVTALDVLGLEIEQCVVSCFSDFAMQASCSQAEGKRQVISTDEIKQALLRSAGYGARCL